MIEKNFQRHGQVKILDLGGSRSYWYIVPANILTENNVSITLVNLTHYECPDPLAQHFEYMDGDACNLSCYSDNTFHIVHSNSVIEHVGNWKQMQSFAHEARRLAPDLFVQTPNFWFFWEPHFRTPFYHWLPEPVRVELLMRYHLGFIHRAKDLQEAVEVVESTHLIDKKMMQILFPDAVIQEEKFFLMTKSLMAIREGLL